MSWILDHLNIVIVGVLVLGSFLKSRFDALNQNGQDADDVPDFEVDERSERPFPAPAPYVPPPVPVQPSGGAPPVFTVTRSQSGAMTASADEAAAVLQKQRDIEERLRTLRESRSTKVVPKVSARARGGPTKPAPSAAANVPTSIRSRLRNPGELRRAFVLREILDAPVSLR